MRSPSARPSYPENWCECGRRWGEDDYCSAFFFAAQYAFIRAACFFRCAALNVLVFLWPFSLEATIGIAFFGGRPRRLVPSKTSIARKPMPLFFPAPGTKNNLFLKWLCPI